MTNELKTEELDINNEDKDGEEDEESQGKI